MENTTAKKKNDFGNRILSFNHASRFWLWLSRQESDFNNFGFPGKLTFLVFQGIKNYVQRTKTEKARAKTMPTGQLIMGHYYWSTNSASTSRLEGRDLWWTPPRKRVRAVWRQTGWRTLPLACSLFRSTIRVEPSGRCRVWHSGLPLSLRAGTFGELLPASELDLEPCEDGQDDEPCP